MKDGKSIRLRLRNFIIAHLSVCLSILLSVCLFHRLCVCLCLSACLSVCPYVFSFVCATGAWVWKFEGHLSPSCFLSLRPSQSRLPSRPLSSLEPPVDCCCHHQSFYWHYFSKAAVHSNHVLLGIRRANLGADHCTEVTGRKKKEKIKLEESKGCNVGILMKRSDKEVRKEEELVGDSERKSPVFREGVKISEYRVLYCTA